MIRGSQARRIGKDEQREQWFGNTRNNDPYKRHHLLLRNVSSLYASFKDRGSLSFSSSRRRGAAMIALHLADEILR